MRIAIIVEGQTEKAFLPSVRDFLKVRLSGRMPKLDALPCDGRILRGKDLLVSAQACPELKAFLNTILNLCGADAII